MDFYANKLSLRSQKWKSRSVWYIISFSPLVADVCQTVLAYRQEHNVQTQNTNKCLKHMRSKYNGPSKFEKNVHTWETPGLLCSRCGRRNSLWCSVCCCRDEFKRTGCVSFSGFNPRCLSNCAAQCRLHCSDFYFTFSKKVLQIVMIKVSFTSVVVPVCQNSEAIPTLHNYILFTSFCYTSLILWGKMLLCIQPIIEQRTCKRSFKHPVRIFAVSPGGSSSECTVFNNCKVFVCIIVWYNK